MKPMTITILQAEREHLDQVTPLFDAYRQFYRQPSDEARAQAFLQARLDNQDSLIFFAVDEASSRGVGFTQLYPAFSSVRTQSVWILNDLFVVPEARGQGVGRQLMDAARRAAQQAGVVALSLATEKNNTPAKALYESLGYKQDSAFDYYELSLV
jgi:ribosomal protein S18 acetylase RimI-like enzyme